MRTTQDPPANQPSLPSDAKVNWGKQLTARLSPELRERLRRADGLGRRLAIFAPCLVTALVLLAMAFGYYARQNYATAYPKAGLAAFADIGSFSAQRVGDQRLAVSGIGYDGQFYYFIAADPKVVLTCQHITNACPMLDAELRVERILYPLTVWAVSLGHPGLVPFALLFVNFLAILITALLVGLLCVEAGASRWLGAAAALFSGEVLGFLRDLADPFAVMWLVLAVYLFRKNRPLWGAAAVAAALLSREQLLLIVPLLWLPLLAERRWRILGLSAAIAFAPFLAWQVALRALYGSWALTTGDTGHAPLVPLPFLGLWQENTRSDFGMILLMIAIPVALAAVIALLAIWRSGPRSLLRDPLPLIVLLYSLLVSVTGYLQWQDAWAPARLAAPAVVLAVIVSASLPRPTLRTAYATLLAMSAFAPLILTIR